MNTALIDFVTAELDTQVQPEISAMARLLADQHGGVAVLFYGSNLRTAKLEGVLDFYVLTGLPHGSLVRRLGTRWLWPDVGFHEIATGPHLLRAKVAVMPVATFEAAAAGQLLDTTVWTRFAQPAALVWAADPATALRVRTAVASAAVTACRFAAVLGPLRGTANDYWRALFTETYSAEIRVEPPGRANEILSFNPDRYEKLLPLAWTAGGVPFDRQDTQLSCDLRLGDCADTVAEWMARAWVGPLLNAARLIKATFTFEGAARYGAWKIERHTGIRIALTPWRERHPILAAPAVLWQIMRARMHTA